MELRGGVPWDVLEGGRDASSSRRACVAPVASARPAASAESKAFGSMVPGGGPPVTSHVFMQLAQRDQTSNLGGAEALLLQVVDGDARDELRPTDTHHRGSGALRRFGEKQFLHTSAPHLGLLSVDAPCAIAHRSRAHALRAALKPRKLP